MSKHFLLATLLASAGCLGYAQSRLETYSVYDVNHENGTTVADATMVVNRAIEAIKEDPQVVDAAQLNKVLEMIDARLAAIESKLGLAAPEEPTTDPFNGHAYVDLGLKDEQGHTIYWATCNVGATIPEDYGDYFAWGETEPYYQAGHSQDNPCESWKTGKTGYNWANYKWCNGSNNTQTKYCTTSSYGTVDNKTVLEPADDAATQNWGGNWRMPTTEEQDQLCTSCTWTWNSTKKGYTVTGTNGNSIFLPATGCRYGSYLGSAGSDGLYWSSSLGSSNSSNAYYLYFNSGYQYSSDYDRFYGRSVRAVCVSIE